MNAAILRMSKEVLIFLGLMAFLFFAITTMKRAWEKPREGMVEVSTSFLDSLRLVAEMPPDTVVRDTVIYEDTIIYKNKLVPFPVPDTTKPGRNIYRDSIVNPQINVWARITVQGVIEDWDWQYKPITRLIKTTIHVPKPYPVKCIIKEPQAGLCLIGGVGMGKGVVLSGELDYINIKGRIYGLQYLRFDNDDFCLVKAGIIF